MSKFITNLNNKMMKYRISDFFKKSPLDVDIKYINESEDKKETNMFLKEILNPLQVFLKQLLLQNNNKLKFNIVIDCDTNFAGTCSYNGNNDTLCIKIKNRHKDLLITLNHEFLHVLDYKNGNPRTPFSEILNPEKDVDIKTIQSLIISNGSKRVDSIKSFDYSLLNSMFELYFENSSLSKKEIGDYLVSNFLKFHKFLNAVDLLKGNYYLYNDDFDLKDYLNTKNKKYVEFKDLYQDVDVWQKRINYIKKRSGINKDGNYLAIDVFKQIIKKDFSGLIESPFLTYRNIFRDVGNSDIHTLRNMYFTLTLDLLIPKPNPIFLEKMVQCQENNIDPAYLFNASEKISFCGQYNHGNILNVYLQQTLLDNKLKNITLPRQEFEENYNDLSVYCEKAFYKFINKPLFNEKFKTEIKNKKESTQVSGLILNRDDIKNKIKDGCFTEEKNINKKIKKNL